VRDARFRQGLGERAAHAHDVAVPLRERRQRRRDALFERLQVRPERLVRAAEVTVDVRLGRRQQFWRQALRFCHRYVGRFGCTQRSSTTLERFIDPPQLAEHERQRNQDQTARNRDRARDYQRIAQAERIDRNTESDRHQTGGGRQQANSHQNDSHRVSVPLPVHGRQPHSLTNCGGLPAHPQAPR